MRLPVKAHMASQRYIPIRILPCHMASQRYIPIRVLPCRAHPAESCWQRPSRSKTGTGNRTCIQGGKGDVGADER